MQFHSLWNGEIQGDIQPNTSFFINHLSFSTLIPASSWLPLSPPPSLFHHPPFSLSFSVPPSLSLSLCLSFPVISRHAVGGFCPLGVSTNHAIEPCRHRGTLAHTHTLSICRSVFFPLSSIISSSSPPFKTKAIRQTVHLVCSHVLAVMRITSLYLCLHRESLADTHRHTHSPTHTHTCIESLTHTLH